jgi:hypothetical protein
MESGAFWDTELAEQSSSLSTNPTVSCFGLSTNPPGPPSVEVDLPDNVIHAKPLPPTPQRSTVHRSRYVLREVGAAEKTMIVCGIFVVYDGQKYRFRAVGKYRTADYVGHVADYMYWNKDRDLSILHGGVMTKHRIPAEVRTYKICHFMGKVRFLFAYAEYATLSVDCRYMGIRTIPSNKSLVYYFDGRGIVPADYIGENSVLVFFGHNLRFPLQVGQVKKKHLIIRENSIVWHKKQYNMSQSN